MKFEEAVKKLMEDEEIKGRMEKGYYVSSLLLTPKTFHEIKEWHFIFFHPSSGDVFSAAVSVRGVKVGTESQPLVEDHYEPLDLNNLKPMEVLAIIEGEARELDPSKITKIIITLREGKWRAAIMTSDMKMLRIDVDRETKKVTKKESTSMLR